MQTLSQLLQDTFNAQAREPALDLPDTQYSYAELEQHCRCIAEAITSPECERVPALGVFTSGDVQSYAAFATTLISGRTYIPLSSTLPLKRLIRVIEETGLQTVLVSAAALPMVQQQFGLLLAAIKRPLQIAYAEEIASSISPLLRMHPEHRFTQIASKSESDIVRSHTDAPAYLLYTSGSSGEPKPVAISQANLQSYLQSIVPLLNLQPGDRCAQANDMSFDLSIHDMLLAWISGACLVPVPRNKRLTPARFISEQRLSAWLSTPHIGATMFAASKVEENSFPNLRLVLHAGEPFPLSLAKQWRLAAPRSRILNLYGPSETTIAIAAFEWQEGMSDFESPFLPIGRIFSTHQYTLCTNASLHQTEESGELCIQGPQVFSQLSSTPEETATAADLWYETGDLCEKLPSGNLLFLGRFDQTVKIRGFRVNLLEVENALREALGVQDAAAISWPPAQLAANEIYAFVQVGGELSEQDCIAKMREYVPPYMVPARITPLVALPQTASGKVDRRALCALITK